MYIKPLPGDVVAQIKSSVVITSLNKVVCGLIRNSLDAGATKINISVDYSRGNCSLEDNGHGIPPSEFQEAGGLGHLHYTSKYPARPEVYGKHGTFLASLASLSLLTITSHHREYHSHNSMSIHNSRVLTRHTPALPEQRVLTFNHGTRVTVRDLFGSMPVRVKHRALQAERSTFSREWEQLVLDVVALLLAWPGIASVAIREASSQQTLTLRRITSSQAGESSISDCCRLLHQASLCDNPDPGDWVAIGASAPSLYISGYVCRTPIATKRVQFVSLGIDPLSNESRSNVLYEEINKVFADSSFGVIEDNSDSDSFKLAKKAKLDGFTNRELKARKGVDRWPMFFIRISFKSAANKKTLQVDDILDERQQNLAVLTDLLRAMFYEFLKKNHCRPKAVTTSAKGRLRPDNASMLTPNADMVASMASPSTVHRSSRANSQSHTSLIQGEEVTRKAPPLEQFGRRSESPFASWSMIKAGRTLRTYKKPNDPASQDPSVAASTPRSLHNTVSTSISEQTNSVSTASSRPSLYDANGKLTRRPFEDMDVSKPRHNSATQEKESPGSPNRPVPKETHVWINPVTKLSSIVDARTGYVIPPKPVTLTRRLSTQTLTRERTESGSTQEATPWVKSLMSKWKNPVFELTEAPIPRLPDVVHTLGIDSKPGSHRYNGHSSLTFGTRHETSAMVLQGRLSKATLQKAQLIAQVDRKFILAQVPFDAVQTREERLTGDPAASEQSSFLVLIDQHAADERCQVETLMKDYFKPIANEKGGRIWKACSERLEKPLQFELSSQEQDLLNRFSAHFEHWGICYDLITTDRHAPGRPSRLGVKVAVRSLPPSIMERCRTEPRLLADLIRTEAWKLNDESATAIPLEQKVSDSGQRQDDQAWVSRLHSCPQGILDLINSRSCRSAIMFNDVLTMDQCASLLERLVRCAFPFQCAHGRPSMVPLVDLGDKVVDLGRTVDNLPAEEPFLQKFKKWKETF